MTQKYHHHQNAYHHNGEKKPLLTTEIIRIKKVLDTDFHMPSCNANIHRNLLKVS